MNEFKVKDRVTILTTAGSRMFDGIGQFIGGRGFGSSAIVVAVNCQLPTYSGNYGQNPTNNTIVQLCETKDLIFIHTNNLKLENKKIEIRYFCDNVDVTNDISDETKSNLRR